MQKRTLQVAILAALTLVLVFSMSAVAFASPSWTDLNKSIVGDYGITLEEVGAISDVPSGLFRPYADITRAEFAVMAVKAFGIPLVNPASPTFPDVPTTHPHYKFIEAAAGAGIILGYTDGKFGPNDTATRQQMLSIIARYVGGKAGYYANGVWNWRTAAEIDALVKHFGDYAAIDPAHKTAMAFAYAMGITKGDAYGNLAPLKKTMRIQAAAMLIRSKALVPWNTTYPAKIELVSADKSENLIGQTHTVKFKVTDANGHPTKGALVDFDTLYASAFYVGNISPQAALTNQFGEVSVNLISMEPGTQRLSATIQTITGPATVVATKYWLVLDEVYILAKEDPWEEKIWAENNAGEPHEWCARVVVFGPGPRSTNVQDWYNVEKIVWDPTDIQELDGVDWHDYDDWSDGWCYETELSIPTGWTPRTMAGIDVEWSIVDWAKDKASVGNITKVDGKAVTPAKKATGKTDADGKSCVWIESTQAGNNKVQAVATYAENPYPKLLFNHKTQGGHWKAKWPHALDWDSQPALCAEAWKTWIPHVIGGDTEGPITPAYAVNNTGEVEKFVLTLKDVYGNPIKGYTVEWWLQGVGQFKMEPDGTTWVGIGEQNKKVAVTDDKGQSHVYLKSLESGQTIVHVKVMDKYGLPYKEWNAVKQWYSIDEVKFIDAAVGGKHPVNPVDTPHTFTVRVAGAKYVYTMYDLNKNGLRDDKVLIGDRDGLKKAYGFIMGMNGKPVAKKYPGEDLLPGQVLWVKHLGVAEATEEEVSHAKGVYYTRFADIKLGECEFWHDGMGKTKYYNGYTALETNGKVKPELGDGIKEVWAGLDGKDVCFFTNVYQFPQNEANVDVANGGGPCVDWYNGKWFDTSLKPWVNPWGPPWYVGSITSPVCKVTADCGLATVTINSKQKGFQFVFAVADYKDNPQHGIKEKPTMWGQLRWDAAAKWWTPLADDCNVKVWAQGNVVGDQWYNPVDPEVYRDGPYPIYDNPNRDTICVGVYDKYGNALEGYKVTFEIIGQGTYTTGQYKTYHPFAHFENAQNNLIPELQRETGWFGKNWWKAGISDTNPWTNANKWWGELADGFHPQTAADKKDDNFAWGWTLNHVIDWKLDWNAACVDLVLDETYEELQDRVRRDGFKEFSTIVNIKVYNTAGAQCKEFEVTKVWTLEPQECTELYIEQANCVYPENNFTPGGTGYEDDWYAAANWTADPIDVYDDCLFMRGFVKDQWGNFIYLDSDKIDELNLKVRVTGNFFPVGPVSVVYDLYNELTYGWNFNQAPWYWDIWRGFPAAEWTFVVWCDDNNNNIIDSGEVKSNALKATFYAQAVVDGGSSATAMPTTLSGE